MKTKNLYILYVLILLPYYIFSQNLQEKVKENGRLFYKDMDSAFVVIDTLISEAQKQHNDQIEMLLLDRKCHYFYNKTDIDNLLSTSKTLEKKAKEHNSPGYLASALLYLAESYSLNELPNKALQSLEQAEEAVQKDTTMRAFFIKSNILISQSNIYYDRKEYDKAIAKHKQLVATGSILKEATQYNHFQYINYSNIANVYLNTNVDSAAYYVKKSMALEKNAISEISITGANLFILGKVYEKKKDTSKAIKNYLSSYKILEQTGSSLNTSQLLESLQNIYIAKHKKDSAQIFTAQLEAYNNSTLANKYEALKKIVKEDQKTVSTNNTTLYITITIGVLVITSLLFYFLKMKKVKATTPVSNTTETEQEKLAKNYDLLIELLKKDDPGFLSHFEKIYPDFRNALLNINPELTISEIKFCALLKLNIPTKQIAQYTFIETRTVQNKKHRMRKKLNIPKNTDTYNWFNDI